MQEPKPGEQGPDTFTPDEEMEEGAKPTPEDTPEEKGEGDEWVKTGKSPEEETASQE